uniref:RELT like 1 n=1 Tax=Xiphophorus couchianus TaxID=32473 RepID=A0A3B5M4F5_9TELE
FPEGQPELEGCDAGLLVFLFFLTGLLGFLICHLLKKKGYRCRTRDLEDEEDKLGEDEDENQDTVELRKESIGGIPPHLHTVHSGTDLNSCLLCAQVKAKRGRRQSRTPRFKQRPGEQTVFSVGSLTSVRSTTYGDILPSSYSTKEHKLEGQTEENIEKKRPGIIRTPKLPPVAAGDLASSSEQVLKDRQSSLPLTPPSLLSSSSLQGGRVSSVTIVKASPDSKREFSVITMVDKEEASSSDQRLKSSQDGFKSEREETNPTVRKQEQIFIGESQTQRKETSGGETRSYPGQDKDDMMEMEDIRDCKVTQVEGAEGPREDTDKMLDNQSQQNQEGKCQDDEVSTASRNDPSRETNDTKN